VDFKVAVFFDIKYVKNGERVVLAIKH